MVVGVIHAAVFCYQGYQLRRSVDSAARTTQVTERAYVTGGLGGRSFAKKDPKFHIGIVFTGMNTGRTPAFTKEIYWGACKESEWPIIGKNWPKVEASKHEIWEDVLPPQMSRDNLVYARFTDTPIVGKDNHVCYGRIIYTDIFGNVYETAWKHRVVRKGKQLESEALAGAYSSEWEKPKIK